MPNKVQGVVPKASYADYVSENLGVYEYDSDQMVDTEGSFRANESLEEGVSGLKAIDTTFDNTSEPIVERPRNEDAPRPMDLHRYPHRRL